MSENKKNNSTRIIGTALLDYKPAELRIGKEWLIVFYYKNPFTKKLEIARKRVPQSHSKTERMRVAKKLVENINNKLKNGWSPLHDADDKTFITIAEAVALFIEKTEKEIADNIKRMDTLRTYKSYLKLFTDYLHKKQPDLLLTIEIKKEIVVKYLDYVYLVKKNTPRTTNGHLSFLHTFFNFLIERGYLWDNPTTGITKKATQRKKRIVIDAETKKYIAENLPKFNKNFNVLCMFLYYCLVRRTELTKLKVKDVQLNNKVLIIDSDASKNKRTETVTIPEPMIYLLVEHLQKAKQNDYLFSADNFATGEIKLNPKKISDTWTKFRTIFKLQKEIQFYSLKDTGITDLFVAGIPSIKIRNQARHSELRTTEIYAQYYQKFDDEIYKNGTHF